MDAFETECLMMGQLVHKLFQELINIQEISLAFKIMLGGIQHFQEVHSIVLRISHQLQLPSNLTA